MNQNSKISKSGISEKTWLLILMITSLVTIAVHLYLTAQHYQLKLGLSEGPSICNVSATFNCDTVAISPYATLFGVPMALLGLFSQVIFFVFALAVRFRLSSNSDLLRRYLFWMSLFVAFVSLVMGYFSSVALGTYCLFCIAAYVLSFLQLFGAWKLQEEAPLPLLGADLGSLFMEVRWVLILTALIPALSWVAHKVTLDSYGRGRMDTMIQDSLAHWESETVQNFNLQSGLTLAKNPGNATITIVEFADFLCPHCKVASPSLESFTQSHPDVQLVFKSFPLDGKCNKGIQQQGNGIRCRLSGAVVCAEQLAKKGWEAHHWIFERQEEMSRVSDFAPVSERMSQDLKLEKEAFNSCLDSDATQETLLAMSQEGVQAKIQGTPAIFVNGKMVPSGAFLPVLDAIYERVRK